jgi:hypothetical protein
MPPSELEGTEEEGRNTSMTAMEARTERWRRSGERKPARSQAVPFTLGEAKIRLAGMVGWSAVAGSGAVLLVARAGQAASGQLGILAGVWLGVSAAIWFLPGMLSGKKPKS